LHIKGISMYSVACGGIQNVSSAILRNKDCVSWQAKRVQKQYVPLFLQKTCFIDYKFDITDLVFAKNWSVWHNPCSYIQSCRTLRHIRSLLPALAANTTGRLPKLESLCATYLTYLKFTVLSTNPWNLFALIMKIPLHTKTV
jgi:hypothetical protein